ncbi:DNA polymerase I [bacterium]|nr:DNA polymerase I [bacterium]
MSERLFLLDGMALAYRAYFAFISNPLKNSKGENTSAVFGFTNALIKILEEEKPEYIAVVFDTPEPTFRHKKYAPYKATREKMPEDMAPQLPLVKQISEALGVPAVELAGFEADDIIGTLSVRAAKENIKAYMVTGDKDFMQLINDKIVMYNPLKKGIALEIVEAAGVKDKFGVEPHNITDMLGLMGDTADNIPGVKGIGEKTAAKLILQYGTIENLYEHIDDLKGKVKENLIEYRDNAFLSKDLATIDTNVPIKIDFHKLKSGRKNYEQLIMLLKQLEFTSLIKKFTKKEEDLFSDLSLTDPEKTEPPQKKLNDRYHLVASQKDLNSLIKQLEKTDAFSFDTETTGIDPMQADLVGLSISFQEHEAFYIPVNGELPRETVLSQLKPVLENEKIKKSGQNSKFDVLVLKNCGIQVRGINFDTMIAAHLINSEKDVNIDALAKEYLGYTKIPTSDLIGTGRNQTNMQDIPHEKIAEYACEDADCVEQLKNVLSKKLKETDSDKIFDEIEMPLSSVLADMEYHGVWLDLKILKDMSMEFAKEIKKQEKTIFKEAGIHFNLNSPQQLGDVLFEKLQIQKLAGIEKPKRTGKTKQYATDVRILELYKSLPIIDSILAYRQLTKLKSTYIDGLPPLLNPKTGRIHSTFSQTIASTGRLSSSNPNFQNIPIRTDMGREIRTAFTPQLKNWVLLSADYSQIELRVMAHLSGDENLIQAFKDGEDIHTTTASLVFEIPKEKVTKDLRRKAKDINFGIMYGISPFGLANRIGMSQSDAKTFIQNYFAKYPTIKGCIDKILDQGKSSGFVTTLFGRRRYLPDLQSKNFTVRNVAERAAINTPIQGTAAEIIKIAMIHVDHAIRKEKLKSKMILQVHDELVFEVMPEEIDTMKSLVKEKMENAVKIKAPLKVDIGVGDNWLETK